MIIGFGLGTSHAAVGAHVPCSISATNCFEKASEFGSSQNGIENQSPLKVQQNWRSECEPVGNLLSTCAALHSAGVALRLMPSCALLARGVWDWSQRGCGTGQHRDLEEVVKNTALRW